MGDIPAVRFVANVDKIVEALTWLASRWPGITIFYACKILFLADREHLRRYGRPILGDRYIAMEDGPVPSLVYYVAQHDGFHLGPETLERADHAFTYEKTGRNPQLFPKRDPNVSMFSRTDLACLTDAMERYGAMDFEDLWNLVHDDRAYKAAWNGIGPNADMNYELLLDPKDPHFKDQLRDLKELAPYLTF
jgi:hypothetical protein